MKVRFVQNQPHCFAYGGFEIQMLSTLKAVQDVGIAAEKLDPWSRDNDFDIVHLWGLELNHCKILHFAKKDGKKVVVTALFDSYETPYKKLRHFISSKVYKTRILKEMAREIDKIVVINELEADIARKYFDVPYSKISVIPIIVNDAFFSNENKKSNFQGLSDYVLCTGNICRRKNQLNLVKACKLAGLNLVLMGNVLTGEEHYAKLVQSEVDNKSIFWLKGISENSSELIDSYQNCSVFALLSFLENSPISVFEALASGCKVVLADRRYSYQDFYRNVERVDPNSIEGIAAALKKASLNSAMGRSSINLIESCRSGPVGNKYRMLYEEVGHG